jgi:hypothetical protein
MKENLTVFTCDSCKKQEISKDVEEVNDAIPRDKGWCYIDVFGDIKQNKVSFQETEKHFCSNNCAISFVERVMMTVKPEIFGNEQSHTVFPIPPPPKPENEKSKFSTLFLKR